MTDSTKPGNDRSSRRRRRGSADRPDLLDLPLRGDGKPGAEPEAPDTPAARPVEHGVPPRHPGRSGGGDPTFGSRGSAGATSAPQVGGPPASPAPPPQEASRRPARPGLHTPRTRHRRERRKWPLVLLLLLLAAAALWWLLPAPARIEASDTSLGFDLTRVGTASDQRPLVLTNTGERALVVEVFRFQGEGGAHYEVDDSGCVGSKVAAGETCEVAVGFRPGSRGPLPATLEVVANARNSPFVVALAGTAVAPLVGLAPETLDFGATPVEGDAVTQTLTISNVGELPLELGRVRIEGPNAREFERQKRCPSTVLAPGDACSFPLTFTPAVAGERQAELVVQNDSPEGEARIPLVGVGLWEGPVFAVDSESLDFGEQRVDSRSPAKVVNFRNPTPGPITVSAVKLEGDAAFSVDSGTCLDTRLEAGEGCRIDVVFAPVDERSRRGDLEVRARESEEPVRVALRGLGVLPKLAVESDSLSFGSTRTGLESGTRDAVFLNSGTGTLRLSDVELGGDRGESFRVRKDQCSKQALGPGKTCAVAVSFRPQGVGAERAELKLAAAEGNDSVLVDLAGTGIVSGMALDRSQLDFGDVYRTRHEDRKLTLTNAGSAALTVSRMQIIGPGADDYQLANIGCSLDQGLSEGKSCVVTVRFVPSVDGKRAAQLVIEHNGPKSPSKVRIRGIAQPPVPAFRASTERFDFGSLPEGRASSIQTLTLSNPGAGWLSLRRILVRGIHAEDFEIVPGTCDGVPALAPGGSCTVGLRFTAKAVGRRSGELRVEHDASGSPGRIFLDGRGAG